MVHFKNWVVCFPLFEFYDFLFWIHVVYKICVLQMYQFVACVLISILFFLYMGHTLKGYFVGTLEIRSHSPLPGLLLLMVFIIFVSFLTAFMEGRIF